MCWHFLKENSDGAHDQHLEMGQRCLLHSSLASGGGCCFEMQGFQGVVACVCGPFQEEVFFDHQTLAQELEALVPSEILKVE